MVESDEPEEDGYILGVGRFEEGKEVWETDELLMTDTLEGSRNGEWGMCMSGFDW